MLLLFYNFFATGDMRENVHFAVERQNHAQTFMGMSVAIWKSLLQPVPVSERSKQYLASYAFFHLLTLF